MDLVRLYSSDDEMENKSHLTKTVKKESSDESDGIEFLFQKTVTGPKKRKKTNTIDVICIDDSDSETIISFPPIKKETSKKVDYLNLESSDTDDEQDRIQKNVNNLLSSAAILNDIEYGPPPKLIREPPGLIPLYVDQLMEKMPSLPSTSVVNRNANTYTIPMYVDEPVDIKPSLPSTSVVNENEPNITNTYTIPRYVDEPVDIKPSLPSTSVVFEKESNITTTVTSSIYNDQLVEKKPSLLSTSAVNEIGLTITNTYTIPMYEDEPVDIEPSLPSASVVFEKEPNITTTVTSSIYNDQLVEKKPSLLSTSVVNEKEPNITNTNTIPMYVDEPVDKKPSLPSTSIVFEKEPNITTTVTSSIYNDQLVEKKPSLPSTSVVNVQDLPSTSVVNVRDLPSTSFVNVQYLPSTSVVNVRDLPSTSVVNVQDLPSTSVVNVQYGNNTTTSSIINVSVDRNYSQGLSNRRFNSGFISTDGIVNIVEGLDQRIKMYRRDARIAAAAQKQDNCCIPSVLTRRIIAHQKAISSLSWCALPYSHLFLSSSLDSTVKVWDIYSQNNIIQKPIQLLKFPLGIRTAKWSYDGEQILAGGFGKLLHVNDVLSGKSHMEYKVYSDVSCIAIHPFIEDVVLCGTKNTVFGFDLRVNSGLPVRTFLSQCGEVLDIAFLNKNEFVCSTSVVSQDSADRTIMVWDFNSGAIMSNQVYLERYTCPSLKVTPTGSGFIAQTNGDYIALFSSQKPYRMMNKRYMSHKVSGFGIECDISPDGRYVASGDAKGDVYFYNSGDTALVKQLTIKRDFATNRLQWHPLLPSTMIVATWDGQIQVWK